MFRFVWWKDKDNRDGISAIVGALKIVVPAGLAVLIAAGAYLGLSPAKPPSEAPQSVSVSGSGNSVQTGDGVQVVQGNNGSIIIGMTIEQHEVILQRRMSELRQDLDRATTAEKRLIEQELAAVNDQLENLQTSYDKAVEDLRQLRIRLQDFEGRVPPEQFAKAQQALYQGDRSLADELFAALEAELADEVALAAEAAFGRGEIAEQEIRWHDAYRHFKRAVDLNDTLDHLKTYAHMSWRLAKIDDALSAQQKLVDRVGSELGTESTGYANQLGNLALVFQAQGRYDKAEELYRQVLEVYLAKIEKGHPAYAIHYSNLATVLRAQGQYKEAEELFRQSLEIDQATIGEQHPNYAIGLNNLALLLQDQGRYDEAESLHRQALGIDLVTIGEQHPDYAIHLSNLALVLHNQGRYDEAESLHRQALEIDLVTVGDQHPNYAIHLSNLAAALRAQQHYEEAEEIYRQVLEIGLALFGDRHPQFATILNNLAAVLQAQQRYTEAEELYRQSIEIDMATVGAGHPSYAIGISNLAVVVQAEGRYDEAEDLFREALEIFEATLPADHPRTQRARDKLLALRAEKP